MKTTSVLACVGLLLLSTASAAAIVIIPATPLSTQTVVVRLTNQYLSAASITAAMITRNGNQFTISQTVNVACGLPLAPVLVSEFDVGVLPPGNYQVVANIQQVGFEPGCNPGAVTQNASFSVMEPTSVPTGNPWTYLATALLLMFLAAWQIERRGKA